VEFVVKSGTCRGPVLGRAIWVDVIIPEGPELGIQPLLLMITNNITVFIFKESQNTSFFLCDTLRLIVIGFAIAVIGISIMNLDYRNLNHIIPSPFPVFDIQIVRLVEGYWSLRGWSTSITQAGIGAA